jgi:hypothetical protein
LTILVSVMKAACEVIEKVWARPTMITRERIAPKPEMMPPARKRVLRPGLLGQVVHGVWQQEAVGQVAPGHVADLVTDARTDLPSLFDQLAPDLGLV